MTPTDTPAPAPLVKGDRVRLTAAYRATLRRDRRTNWETRRGTVTRVKPDRGIVNVLWDWTKGPKGMRDGAVERVPADEVMPAPDPAAVADLARLLAGERPGR